MSALAQTHAAPRQATEAARTMAGPNGPSQFGRRQAFAQSTTPTDTVQPTHDFSRIPTYSPARVNSAASQIHTGTRQAQSFHAGSDAPNAEEQQGPTGDSGGPTTASPEAPITAEAPPVAEAPAEPAMESSAPEGTTGELYIGHATVQKAPSDTDVHRTRVGVGEDVYFAGTEAGTWSADIGTASGASSTTFKWTAPAVASVTTATITLTAGTRSATKKLTVCPPNSISMVKKSSHTALVGAGGACMLTEVTFGPSDVCLGAIQTLEVPGPATVISGFFTKFSAATLHHNPNTNYALVNDSNKKHAGPNNGDFDHCSWHSTPGPYKDGAFRWVVPNNWKLDGEADSKGRHFTDTIQQFTMTAAGTMTITKAGAST